MATKGLPQLGATPEHLHAEGLRLAVVTSSWNVEICDTLHERAMTAGREAGAAVAGFRVVGALELPVVVQAAAQRFDAVVACGCVIRGGTPHFDYVCDSVTAGLNRVGLDEATPIGNGVLTTETQEQALARCGGPGSVEDKGAEAAIAALHSAAILAEIRAY